MNVYRNVVSFYQAHIEIIYNLTQRIKYREMNVTIKSKKFLRI